MTKKKGLAATLALLLAILLLGGCVRLAFLRFFRAAYPVHYRDTVLLSAAQNDLPPELVFAVIRSESGFDHRAVSYVEARGLMQITKDTFEWAHWRTGQVEDVAFDDLFLPETNIKYGTAILRLLLDEFGTEQVALSAYHAGWGNVKRWLENEKYSPDGQTLDYIPFGDTRAYVDKVLKTQETYRSLYNFTATEG